MDPGPFLLSVLGRDGYKALRKATVQDRELEQLLLPRTVLAWVGLVGQTGYEGAIPGTDIALSLSKSARGLSGNVGLQPFSEESVYRVAARLHSALGFPLENPATVRRPDLTRLGKSVDLLVRCVGVRTLQKKLLDPQMGYKISHKDEVIDILGDKTKRTIVQAHNSAGEKVGEADFLHNGDGTVESIGTDVHPDHRRLGLASAMYGHAEKVTGAKIVPSTARTPEGKALWEGNAAVPQFGKAEETGAVAAPTAPGGPVGPSTMPTRVKARIPRRTVGIASLSKSCGSCSKPMFRGGRLACGCWSELAHDAELRKSEQGFQLLLGSSWTQASVEALIQDLK